MMTTSSYSMSIGMQVLYMKWAIRRLPAKILRIVQHLIYITGSSMVVVKKK
jgi:hypothetical protein